MKKTSLIAAPPSFPESIREARKIVAALEKDKLAAFKRDLKSKIDYLKKQAAIASSRKEAEALAERAADLLLSISFIEVKENPPIPPKKSGATRGKKGVAPRHGLRDERRNFKGIETEDQLESKVKEIKAATGEKVLTPRKIREFQEKKAAKDRIEAAKTRKAGKGAREKLRDFSLRTLPINELRKFTKPNSIDLILTDPPYQRHDLERFNELSYFASETLKPGGSLLVFSGQLYFSEVYKRLQEYKPMQHHWILAYVMRGPTSRVIPARVTQSWKPVFWLIKGKSYEEVGNNKYQGEYVRDSVVLETKQNDTEYHKWGQSVAGMEALLKKGIVFPGDTVCDPFLGAGSTAIAAYRFGCKFIGADVDKEAVKITRGRLAEEAKNGQKN